MNKLIYLDNNATTQMDPRVLFAMMPFLKKNYGNPSSPHASGRMARKAVEDAREIVAECINARPYEIFFTSGGTESANMALLGITDAIDGAIPVITSQIEHPCVMNTCRMLENSGYQVTYLPVDEKGIVEIRKMEDFPIPAGAVKLVSIMLANNETGVIQPLHKFVEILKTSAGAIFHTDAVQAAGKIPIDVKKLNVDFLSLSAHKFHGPKGIGALFARKEFSLKPVIFGGGQERGVRPGTENVAGIIGMARALELAVKDMERNTKKMFAMKNFLINGLKESFTDVSINSEGAETLPNTISVSFKGREADKLLIKLDIEGICVSFGAACHSGASKLSDVLKAMKTPDNCNRGTLRISLSRFNTMQEMVYLLGVLRKIM